jgi:uncharacterized protein (DUF433 family)
MQPTSTQSLPIQQDPQLMSGVPVFAGTRVPVQTLFDYLIDGYSVPEFLDQFPTVTQDHVQQVLRFVQSCLPAGVSAR